jgi:hypothetical protein
MACSGGYPGAGHGYSVDLLIIDEAWAVSTEAVDQGFVTYATCAQKSFVQYVEYGGRQ